MCKKMASGLTARSLVPNFTRMEGSPVLPPAEGCRNGWRGQTPNTSLRLGVKKKISGNTLWKKERLIGIKDDEKYIMEKEDGMRHCKLSMNLLNKLHK